MTEIWSLNVYLPLVNPLLVTSMLEGLYVPTKFAQAPGPSEVTVAPVLGSVSVNAEIAAG